MNRVIDARALRYSYPDGTKALDGVDFCLDRGECAAVFGANGSGKTTFVQHLVGLLFGEGAIEVCGISVSRDSSAKELTEVRSKVGLVFQDSDEQLFLPTVMEDVAFGPLNLGLGAVEAEQRAMEALERVGMRHVAGKFPYHLSSGEKRRVALAGVLATDPEVLVLDEPTTALDPPGQRDLIRILSELPQAKLLVTHDTDFAAALATRAVFFEHGRVVGEGTVDEIVSRFGWTRR